MLFAAPAQVSSWHIATLCSAIQFMTQTKLSGHKSRATRGLPRVQVAHEVATRRSSWPRGGRTARWQRSGALFCRGPTAQPVDPINLKVARFRPVAPVGVPICRPCTVSITYPASLSNSTGSMIEGSSFSGLFTRVDIGHIRIKADGNGRIKSRGSGSSLSHRV
jgi:hypothetical protein